MFGQQYEKKKLINCIFHELESVGCSIAGIFHDQYFKLLSENQEPCYLFFIPKVSPVLAAVLIYVKNKSCQTFGAFSVYLFHRNHTHTHKYTSVPFAVVNEIC